MVIRVWVFEIIDGGGVRGFFKVRILPPLTGGR